MKGVSSCRKHCGYAWFVRYSQVASSSPIKIGFQVHRTGIGALMGDGMIELHKHGKSFK